MRRSRSSFDLGGALEKAAALTPKPPDAKPAREDPYAGVALVSFDAEPTAIPPVVETPGEARPAPLEDEPTDPSEVDTAPSLDETVTPDTARPPPVVVVEAPPPSDPTPMPPTPPAGPPVPDLSGVSSEGARCERVVQWMRETMLASEIFVADDQGLPVAGLTNLEVRAAGAGGVAHAVRRLSVGVPGDGDDFEAQLTVGGSGPGSVFQMLGFSARGRRYVVGLTRETALSAPLIASVRHAFRLALFDAAT